MLNFDHFQQEEVYEEPVVLPTPKPYVEPSERVAATKPAVKVGEVKTWSVTVSTIVYLLVEDAILIKLFL